ncbi:MAG: PKD domain-containing protein [Planctomycetota bacterium]
MKKTVHKKLGSLLLRGSSSRKAHQKEHELKDMPQTSVAGFERLEERMLLSADIFTGPADDFLTGFGEPGATFFVQTFTADESGFADELTFQARPAGSPITNSFNPVNFNVLITEVDNVSTSGPDLVLSQDVLFESSTISLPPGDGTQPPTDVVVDLQGLELQAGVTYAWVIDTLVAFDGLIDQAQIGVLNPANDFAGGQLFFTNSTTSREAVFDGGSLSSFPTSFPDASFSLTFLTAPTADAGGAIVGTEGQAVTFDASGSTDPDNDIVLYEFDTDFDGITFNADVTSAAPIADFTYGDDFTGTVAVRVTDAEGQFDIATTSVSIANAAPTVAVDNAVSSAQYSDALSTVTFTATDVADDAVNATVETSTDGGATFTAGLPDLGTIAGGLAFNGPADAPGGGVYTIDGLADLAPGDYIFRVSVTDEDGGVAQATAELSVAAEDATAIYTGPEAVSTEADSDAGAFSVELRAFVQEDFDGAAGDFSTADVTFRLTPSDGGAAIELSAAVAPSSDPTLDVVTAVFTDELGVGVEDRAYTVEVLVGGNYVATDVALLNVTRPDDSRAFGFGSIVEQNAQGGQVEVQNFFGGTDTVDLSVADDSRVRFSFFADFRRGNLIGGFNAVFRGANGDFWLLTSDNLTSFTTEVDPDGDATTRDFSASLIGTARLVNLSTFQWTDTLTLEVDVTDNRTRGVADTIGFALWDGDDLALSSNFDGIDTVEQALSGGNTRIVAR